MNKKPHFIAWYGGECPVTPKTRVEVVFRDLVVLNMDQRWIWAHSGESDDIIAYRVIEENMTAVENSHILVVNNSQFEKILNANANPPKPTKKFVDLMNARGFDEPIEDQ